MELEVVLTENDMCLKLKWIWVEFLRWNYWELELYVMIIWRRIIENIKIFKPFQGHPHKNLQTIPELFMVKFLHFNFQSNQFSHKPFKSLNSQKKITKHVNVSNNNLSIWILNWNHFGLIFGLDIFVMSYSIDIHEN